MKSLNLRFTEQHIKAMNELVNAKLYSSVADVVRAAVRDLLLREYFGREETIQNMILAHGGVVKDTYGLGDRAKSHKAPQKKVKKSATPIPEADSGSMGVGGYSEPQSKGEFGTEGA